MKQKVSVDCAMCGKKILRWPCHVKNHKHLFCSSSCFSKHRKLFNPASSSEVRRKMSISAKARGRQTNQDGRIFNSYCCRICGNLIHAWTALYGDGYCKRCVHAGERNCNFGKTILIKFCKYKNQWFKSLWEANFAKWCDGSGIKWKYEPKAWKLKLNNKNTNYIPDFYLPEFDVWIEIKGYWRKDAKEKFELCQKQYPEIELKAFCKNELQTLGVI